MTDRNDSPAPPADGPPVFLPEPPRRPGEARLAPPPERDPPPDAGPQPGRGTRLPQPDEGLKTQGIPTWMIFVGLVGTLFLSIESGSPIPFVVGVLFFILLRRKRR
jgi:hypothetical protein